MPSDKKTTAALEGVFKQINREKVRIKKRDRVNNNHILFSVLDEIFKRMKKINKLFASLRPRIEYMGSYFEGLRVGQPTEYDINIVLKLLLNYADIQLDARKSPDGYTNIIMPSEFRRSIKNPQTVEKGFQATENWCDQEHRLNLTKFKSWMQSVLVVALNGLPTTDDNRKVLTIKNQVYFISDNTSNKSPANTISIMSKSNKHFIDVDLVSTFAIRYPKISRGSKVLFDKIEATNELTYFLVPKLMDEGDEYSWRISFPLQEKLLMKNKHYMKSSLKLLKLLRDTQNMTGLSSYFIKTLFLHELESERLPQDLWERKSLTYLTLFMLEKLKESLARKEIRNYWCPEHNLIGNIKAETIENWDNRLSYILNDINRNAVKKPQLLLAYFTGKPKTKAA